MATRSTGSFRYETITIDKLADHIEVCIRDLVLQETLDSKKRDLQDILLTGPSGRTTFELVKPLLEQRKINYSMDEFFSAMDVIRERSLKARGL